MRYVRMGKSKTVLHYVFKVRISGANINAVIARVHSQAST